MQPIKIENENLVVKLIPYGARLVDIRLASFNFPLILGYPNIKDYHKDVAYLGAIIGRVANRIHSAQSEIGGVLYTFDVNERSEQTLHGGSKSCAFQNWTVKNISDTSVTLFLDEPDGHMGFPGNIHFEVCYEINDYSRLQITMQAISDKDGICNLTSHPYFCLDDSGDISSHELTINASRYLPVNESNIPTGKINTVSNSEFDFLKPRGLAEIVKGTSQPIDHNFCLNDKQLTLREAAVLTSKLSNINLRVLSTESGLQFYTGHHLLDTPSGYGNRPYTPFSGLCLEPQGWPDAPNKPNFPSIFLPANTLYQQIICFEFTKN